MIHEFTDTIIEIADSLGWNNRIIIPDNVMDHFKQTDKRVKCSVNESEPIQCAIHSNGDGTYFLTLSNDFRKKNKLNAGDAVKVKIQKDDSKYGIATPDFFEELCHQDPEGSEHFHNLTPGKQRSLLHIVSKLKSELKQLEKALTIFDYLKSSNGELDFKELNEAFKNSRFKQ